METNWKSNQVNFMTTNDTKCNYISNSNYKYLINTKRNERRLLIYTISFQKLHIMKIKNRAENHIME